MLLLLAVALLAAGGASFFLLQRAGGNAAPRGPLGPSETERLASRLQGRGDHEPASQWLSSGGGLFRVKSSAARALVGALEDAGATEVTVAGYARVGKSGESMRYVIARATDGKVAGVANAATKALKSNPDARVQRGSRHVVIQLAP